MDSFTVEYDADTWLRVPTSFPDADDVAAENWAARQATVQRERGVEETVTSGTLDQYFLDIVDAARRTGEHESFWALIARDAPGFIAITLDVDPAAEPLDDLLSMLTARRGNEYEPASYSQTEAAGLGQGVYVHRLDRDSQDQVVQSLYYVFRAEDTDYIVSTETHDPASLAWAVPKILEFIDGIAPAGAA